MVIATLFIKHWLRYRRTATCLNHNVVRSVAVTRDAELSVKLMKATFAKFK